MNTLSFTRPTMVAFILLFLKVDCKIVSYTFVQKSQCQRLDHKMLGVKYLTDKDRARIVNTHNKLRDKIASGTETRGKAGGQPGAENMQEMSWDDTAESWATELAYKCLDAHEKHYYKGKKAMGQNLASFSSQKRKLDEVFNEHIERLITLWYDEVDLYKFGDQFGSEIGHYTQVMWATTTRVGCGVSFFVKGSANTIWLVCDYYPAGNMRPSKAGEPMNPYVNGTKDCSKHNLKASTKYTNLCSYASRSGGSYLFKAIIIAIILLVS